MNVTKSLIRISRGRYKFSPRIQTARFFCQRDFQPVALRPKKPKGKSTVGMLPVPGPQIQSEFGPQVPGTGARLKEVKKSQFFVDNWHINTVGGKGGDGCISFLQIFKNDKAGPDGGDGGNGGHVIFKAASGTRDLSHLTKMVKASNGEQGFNRDCHGKSAKHEYVKVPVGTIIRNKNGVIVADLNKEGAMFIAARGGAGGRGNHFFTTDTLQAPEVAEFGAEGETHKYILEVKVMAHIGLVGMPNAGKSTLLQAITRARPTVAGYAFTTLKPHIGVVQYTDYEQIAVADLPGLVEGSHRNEGLGIEFLKHVERCMGLLFVIDLSQENPFWQYETLRYEISKFSEELNSRPYAVVANKIDLTEAQNNLEEFQSKIENPVIAISAKTGKNLSQLLSQIRVMYDSEIDKDEEG